MARGRSKAQGDAAAQQYSGEILSQGIFTEPGVLKNMLEVCIREVIEAEFEQFLGAGPYERSERRRGHRNGRKPRTMKTSVGELKFDIPQSRQGGFRPSAFERYQRSDRALIGALQEMMVQGVSTRRVGEVLEQMAGFSVSAQSVSRAMSELDEEIARWRNRPLDERRWPYLIVDARYERVRVAGRVVSQAVLIVAGIEEEGNRRLLGFWTGDSESEAAWSEVFEDLKRRGVNGVEMVVSDAHRGIKAALARQFQGVAWQRCRVHLMRELLKRVSWRSYKELAEDLSSIFEPETSAGCTRRAEQIADKWEKKLPRMSRALREGIEDCLTAKKLGGRFWRKLNSTNMLERLMRELKRRTRVVSIFPNIASCERLMGALVMEIDETWVCEKKRYVAMDVEEIRG